MNNDTRSEADRLEQHLLDQQAREMVRGAASAGMPLEECEKSLTRALYAELPRGAPKGPIVKKARQMIREVYKEVESEQQK